MNISAYILEYLKQYGSVKVPKFGVFSLEISKAVLNSENGTMLPPSTKIAFHLDYQISSEEFLQYIAEQINTSKDTVAAEMQIQTDFWKKKLQAEQSLEIPNVGRIFFSENRVVFNGDRFEADFPDFYGLEEIKFSDINDDDSPIDTKNEKGDYRLNRSILWIFLILIPVGALVYFAITQQELIFGKKSFEPVSVQTTTKRIEPVKVDSTLINKANVLKRDSIQLDSLKRDSVKNSQIKKADLPKSYNPKSK